MSKDIKKALEHCVEWKCDNCPNRDELGSGEIVCRGRLLPEVLEYVADLEAKLAESEKKAYSRGHSQRDIANEIKLNALREDVANKEKRIVELKKQLAEKEKEIEELKLKLDIRAISLQNFNIERMQANQDKISFALEQLEKVKETLIQNADDIGEEYKEDYFMISLGNVKNIINNQINVLRNNKDGIH